MIKVFKDYTNPPGVLLSEKAEKHLKLVLSDKKIRGKPLYDSESVKTTLSEIYHNRCAYCEGAFGSYVYVDLYRPSEKYKWLIYEWSNLLPICVFCNRSKLNKFPLDDAQNRVLTPPIERKDWVANSKIMLSEKPLLLNPEIDNPAEHLTFLLDGRMTSLTARGNFTIETFNLNRNELINSRLKLYKYFKSTFIQKLNDLEQFIIKSAVNVFNESILKLTFSQIFKELNGATKPNSYYSTYIIYLIENFKSAFVDTLPNSTSKEILISAYELLLLKSTDTENSKYKKETIQKQEVLNIKIDTINISNIKCFEDVLIDFRLKDNILLGINGRGKTTILQLIALALTENEIPPFATEWKEVVRKSASTGGFEITLKTGEENRHFEFGLNEKDRVFIKSKNKINSINKYFLFLAYGSGRNAEPHNLNLDDSFKGIATLFGINTLKLKNGVLPRYFAEPIAISQIKNVINKIFSIADLPEHQVELISYNDNKNTFYFKTPVSNSEFIPLEAMSAGFRTTFAWIFDLIVRAWEKGYNLDKPETINGIILIDEIDNHLHIKWQRSILSTLQKVFSNIQFIISTHSPFIVQSISDRNIVLLKIENDSVIVQNPEVDEGASYESIIGELFGENAIFNKDIENKFKDFYRVKNEIIKRKRDINDIDFKQLVKDLVLKGEEVAAIISGELRQIQKYLRINNEKN